MKQLLLFVILMPNLYAIDQTSAYKSINLTLKYNSTSVVDVINQLAEGKGTALRSFLRQDDGEVLQYLSL